MGQYFLSVTSSTDKSPQREGLGTRADFGPNPVGELHHCFHPEGADATGAWWL